MFLEHHRTAEETPAVREIYTREREHWGFVPNFARPFAWRPEVMHGWSGLLRSIRGAADRRRFELVTFAAAVALRSSYCSLAHGAALRRYFGDEEILALARGDFASVVGPLEAAVMRFAATVAVDATQTTEADVSRLRELGCDDGEIFDIAAIAAGRAFLTKLTDALGVQPDGSYRGESADWQSALAVGRTVDGP